MSRIIQVLSLLLFSVNGESKITFDFVKNKHIHLSFDKTQTTKYKIINTSIVCSVNKSASALIFPFDKVRNVKTILFKFKTNKKQPQNDRMLEESKEGDDSAIKVGLIIKGDLKKTIPFFAPDWIKELSGILKKPSKQIIFIKAWSSHQQNESWESPYSDYMIYVVPKLSKPDHRGFIQATYVFQEPKEIIGLWIMADGDNTKKVFQTEISELEMK